ncbi:MAG: glycosyltransferase family 39 protein [Alphaproteobacteria bacterium]|nr:glycosyltransferase family 39 protein [Alphaproteobacteria bacterium]
MSTRTGSSSTGETQVRAPIRRESVLHLITALLATGCFLGIFHAAQVAPIQVPIDYNEGWNAFHASAAATGQPLYPGAASMMINNYPPLSFYLTGYLGELIGDNILAGRLLSLASAIATCTLLGAWLRKEGQLAVAEATFAVLTFLGTLLVFTRYVGMNDPQLSGHALACGALYLLVRETHTPLRVASGALFLSLAIFTKHNLVALPSAVIIWLWLRDKRQAIAVAASMLTFCFAGLVLTDVLLQTDLLSDLFTSRTYLASGVFWSAARLFGTTFVPMAAIAWLASTRWENPVVCFVVIYTGIAIATGLVFSGGAGVDANAMFDANIALALAVGLTLHELRRDAVATTLVAVGVLLPLAFGTGLYARQAWLSSSYWIRPLEEQRSATARDIAQLRKAGDPVLCETLALCYWAHLRPSVDSFNLAQAYRSHPARERALLSLMDRRKFHAVQVSSLQSLPFSASITSSLQRNYRTDHLDSAGVFMVPTK